MFDFNRLKQLFSAPQPSESPMDEIPRPNMGDVVSRPTFSGSAPIDLELPARSTGGQAGVLTGIPGNNPNQIDLDTYTPEHVGIDRMNDMIAHRPVKTEPGMMRNIFGGVAGAALGPYAREAIRHPGYMEKKADWEDEYKDVIQLANQERGSNANQRAAVTSSNNAKVAQSRIDETTRHNTEVEDNNRKKTVIAQQRANAYEYKTLHPNSSFHSDSKGRLVAVDPVTNQAEYVLDSTGQPINTGDMSDEDKMKWQLKKLDAEHENALDLERERQRNRLGIVDAQHNARTSEIQTRAANKVGTADSATQEKVRSYNAAQAAYNTHPEYQSWVILHDPGSNEFSIKTPAEMPGGETEQNKKMYANILDAIYGYERKRTYLESQGMLTPATGSTPAKTNTPSTQTPPARNTSTTSTPTGKVRVRRKSDGKTGTLDANDPALKSGNYEVIK